jgi:hypothetical protein
MDDSANGYMKGGKAPSKTHIFAEFNEVLEAELYLPAQTEIRKYSLALLKYKRYKRAISFCTDRYVSSILSFQSQR